MTRDYTVTRLKPDFGSRDSTTGRRLIDEWEQIEIEMKIVPRGAAGFLTPAGYYGKIEFYGMCCDPVFEFEHILYGSDRLEVKYVHERRDGDNFLWRDCALTLLGMYESWPGSATWQSSPYDAREKVKDYLDLRIRSAQLTKDDGSTQASWASIFESENYRLAWEFRAASSPVQGLFVIKQPETTPIIEASLTPTGYIENVPVLACAVDSTACSGEQLVSKMNSELRYVTETYEIGSVSNLASGRAESYSLGSDKLYGWLWNLRYKRGLT